MSRKAAREFDPERGRISFSTFVTYQLLSVGQESVLQNFMQELSSLPASCEEAVEALHAMVIDMRVVSVCVCVCDQQLIMVDSSLRDLESRRRRRRKR
jgi:hypothetical protein